MREYERNSAGLVGAPIGVPVAVPASDRIGKIADRLDSLAGNLAAIRDRIYGSFPQPASDQAKRPPGLINRIEDVEDMVAMCEGIAEKIGGGL